MYNPVSTYRIQFNKDYTFRHFTENIDYFLLLKPSSIYASPLFEAAPGSMHGYDVTNPHMINCEIGQYEDFVSITDKLNKNKIGWIQDIVPNHMALHMNNKWLMDVLEKGRISKYAEFFDIDFSHPKFKEKIMIPFLGKELTGVIKEGEINLEWLSGSFVFRYYDYIFPVSFESFLQIINVHQGKIPEEFEKLLGEFQIKIMEGFMENEWPELRNRLENLNRKYSSSRIFIKNTLDSINANRNLLTELLDKQHYRLCYWRESMNVLNYRRFFTVNSLICLKMENDEVFGIYHEFIQKIVREGRFNGLRIDHIDGLQRPIHYLENLRLITGEDTYIVAEKILGLDEELAPDLPIQGTSGYDFLGLVNNVFTFKKNYHALEKFYNQITGIKDDVEEVIYNKKRFILEEGMNGEWDNLVRLFEEGGFTGPDDHITIASIKESIGELLIFFPVYKLYSDSSDFSPEETRILKEVFSKAAGKNPSNAKTLGVIENVFLTREGFNDEKREKALSFFLRFMQFTGPLMAKGVEDTTMYYYNAFICHNEVGDHPGSSGISAAEYHDRMIRRQKYWPMSMNATSTHDTKRGEDVRARLNVISEIPSEWKENVMNWMKLNSHLKIEVHGKISPDVNEEYFIYQTLTGVLPFGGKTDNSFLERMDEYLVKSLREAKTNSNWNDPDEEYEIAVKNFTRQILRPENAFLESFLPFHERIADYGIINSLSQLMLKAMSPGIPDFYQGTELWDFSMVDPDNRRQVDYALRYKMLKDITTRLEKDREALMRDLYKNRTDGRIKLFMTSLLLKERKLEPGLFLHGNYIPLTVKGKFADNILAFARAYKDTWYIVVVPLFLSQLTDNQLKQEPGETEWEDTVVVLPETAPENWSISTGQIDLIFQEQILLSDIMKIPYPLFLKGKKETSKRSAGVLLHITSLPGRYGTGDLGQEAFDFVELLRDSGQKYWQILPFNPVEKGYGWSPYSSTSAFAGNLMFLSPDMLVKSRLLSEKSTLTSVIRESDRTNFKKAKILRNMLLDEVFTNFFCKDSPLRNKDFNEFCEREKYWLDDYVLFVCLKVEFRDLPWFEWPEKIKNRDSRSLSELTEKYEMEIKKEKLGQYLFQFQWSALKKYCNINGVRIIGDMSFYVNYDSSDVWAHPGYFRLDAGRNPSFVAGVPPDYFSSSGQLWGMPVYDWKNMKKDGYAWWIGRIRRNLELCDLVRFDHFRGFSEYWEVPYGEKTAVKGKWVPGPGINFFEQVKKEFPGMPFIAEDLGMIDEKVYKLRDDFSLPGMEVLQFAFGDNTPRSVYTPHNHIFNSIVYTGTHDNNTTKGWYLHELKNKYKKEVEDYVGHAINDVSCHEVFIRMAYSSVARVAIVPMQDLLGLDESSRLNKPSTVGTNWGWKMKKSDLKSFPADDLRKMSILFGRV